jgi:polysaccharide export outer membrane protein
VALAGLLMAGFGCQSSHIDHDSFALPSSNPGSQPAPPRFSFFHREASPSGTIQSQVVGFTPGQPIAQSGAPVTLQPVPAYQAAPAAGPAMMRPPVIASSWQAVQRVSAEQSTGPDLSMAPAENSGVVPVRSPVATPLPAATAVGNGGPSMDDKPVDAIPNGNATLPAPRALTAPPALAYAGPMPPPHPAGDGVPREFEKMALPSYVVEPPDILLIQASDAVTSLLQRIEGQHLVAPDGTVNLGIYGRVRVVGMTLDQVADAVAARLLEVLPGLVKLSRDAKKDEEAKERAKAWETTFSTLEAIKRELQVDVLSYNSKVYYVITDGGGYGQQVYPIPITGNETVLDALAKVNGLPPVASKKKIWVARATRAGQPPKVFPVNWRAVTELGSSDTNIQIFPGDRVFVQSDCLIRFDSRLAKILSPIQRGLGTTLLGASTVNAIKLGSQSGSGLGGLGAIR